MIPVPLWFERKFEFNFPIEQFPSLCMRLRGTPARLEELVRDLAHTTLILKPGDKWSAQEHVGHLLDLEPLWMNRVTDFLTDGQELSVADLSNRKTDQANHNSSSLGKILAGFRAERMNLVNRIQQLELHNFSRSLIHPRLKQPMRLVDHLYFVAEHDDHHLARIWELIQ